MSPSKPSARAPALQRLPKRVQSSRLVDERLQCVIDLAADFYWEQDERYRFTVYRPSGSPDPALDGLMGKTSWEFFGEPEDDQRWAPFLAMLEQRAPFREVLHRLKSDAGIRYFHVSGQAVFDQRGKFKGYRGIARDVSGQVRAERLTRLEHRIAQMLAEADVVASGLAAVIREM
jgi:PAS domain-containing protein